ncbi:hypothetical protein BC827DRAFT_1272505 [Russula dissimulans]|nr:hypothetical protein BC827DRAFT_1272505 [Russula dissimulans]
MDIVLNDIRQCYMEMDRFWVDKVFNVSKKLNLKNRRLDPLEIDRWRSLWESLEQKMACWETGSADNPVARHQITPPPERL